MKVKLFILTFLTFLALEADAASVHLGLKIYYDTAMSHVNRKDYVVVEALNQISKDYPDSKLLIIGHTDVVGTYQVNLELSQGRAEILKKLLMNLGLPADRVSAKWFSFDAPIDTNETEAGRRNNRRVVATFYDLTDEQALALSEKYADSKHFYVIRVENRKVEEAILDANKGPSPEEFEQQRLQDAEAALRAQAEIEAAEQARLQQQLLDEEAERARLAELEEQNRLAQEQAKIAREEARAKFKLNNRFELGWEISDNLLTAKSTDFEAIWVTDFNHALSMAFQHRFSEKFWLGLQGSYKFRSFRIDDSAVYNWDGVTSDLLALAIVSDYEWNRKFNFGVDLKYSEENFIIDEGLNISLEKGSLASLAFRTDYKYYSNDKYSSRLKFAVENPVVGFGDLDPSGSLSYAAGVDFSLHKVMKDHDLNLGLMYGIKNLENFRNTQQENYLGLELKIRTKNWF